MDVVTVQLVSEVRPGIITTHTHTQKKTTTHTQTQKMVRMEMSQICGDTVQVQVE